ncbi:hypothetical protein BCR44DRAFT_213308 [Catenaria anguillulae PL171]|uniref:Uncharacterized protein n=1 Tax=Catenaria anguillulae PL171 TaxID=765915 RepID=A0A1Y2H5E1_9FUNG|nr:hypothetical protein BCR44DRAFT_213308 [Catenaria anguillulae PL171]
MMNKRETSVWVCTPGVARMYKHTWGGPTIQCAVCTVTNGEIAPNHPSIICKEGQGRVATSAAEKHASSSAQCCKWEDACECTNRSSQAYPHPKQGSMCGNPIHRSMIKDIDQACCALPSSPEHIKKVTHKRERRPVQELSKAKERKRTTRALRASACFFCLDSVRVGQSVPTFDPHRPITGR